MTASALRVAIVGGGISGLSTAFYLERAFSGPLEIVVYESSSRLGGAIRTERREGFVIDGGPDSWVVTKPHATQLVRELGLEAELAETVPQNRRVYVAHGGMLHALPEGVVLGVPTRIEPIVRTQLFSWDAKARMALEPLIPKRTYAGDEDESIANFITRRLGEQVTERLAAPMLGGIFAGDAETLSIRAAFPQLVEAEQVHGSLIRAMRARQAAAAAARGAGAAPSMFVSLRDGVGSLVERLAGRLTSTEIAYASPVRAVIAPDASRAAAGVELSDGSVAEVDHVVLAAPAFVATRLLADIDAELAKELATIPYVTTATVFLAYRRTEVPHPLDASGFIVPREAGRTILAGTFVSSKWDRRAPAGAALLRVFFGGTGGYEIGPRSDEELVDRARSELSLLLGVDAKPLFWRVHRFPRSNPQPVLGHLAKVRRIGERVAALPWLHIAGGGLSWGIPDCIKSGAEVAKAIAAAH